MTTTHWLGILGAVVLALFAMLMVDRARSKASLSQIIRTWPHTDTLLMFGVLASGFTLLFHLGCIAFFEADAAYAWLEKHIAIAYDFCRWMVGFGVTASLGRRALTKPEVIDAHARVGATGEMPLPPK